MIGVALSKKGNTIPLFSFNSNTLTQIKAISKIDVPRGNKYNKSGFEF